MARILILDDDKKICQFLSEMIRSLGHEAATANSLEQGLHMVRAKGCDLVLLDLEFPEGNGLQVLPDILDAPCKPEVIIITGAGGIGGAETAFKWGAWDYVQKPFVLHEVTLPITRALEYRKERENAKSPLVLNRTGIIGSSTALGSCLAIVGRASATHASVLITGETGTGKELFARAIHANSKRASAGFITVDCGALPEALAENILFGHERGAFTGADRRSSGLVVQAEGGTLFLDEIGELPLTIQKTLLRCLQERRFLPLGAREEVSVDFRLVAATNRDLADLVRQKRFREDLLYRIRAIEIRLPPLRDRGQDLQEIILRKIHELCQQQGNATRGISPEFLEILSEQKWPGNVRELVNVLEYALASAGEDPILHPKHLPHEYRTAKLVDTPHPRSQPDPRHEEDNLEDMQFPSLPEYREQTENDYLRMLLKKAGGDRKKACRLSGVSQSRLYGLLKKHNLSRFKP